MTLHLHLLSLLNRNARTFRYGLSLDHTGNAILTIARNDDVIHGNNTVGLFTYKN